MSDNTADTPMGGSSDDTPLVQVSDLPPMPSSPPPPPPPNEEEFAPPETLAELSLALEQSQISSSNAEENQSVDSHPAMNTFDALGRQGLYTGATMLDTSTGYDLPHGRNGVMLYEQNCDENDTKMQVRPVKYIGEWMLGHWHGRGTVMYNTLDRYNGSFTTSLKQGDGIYIWADGRQYTGQFHQDFRHGSGEYTWPLPNEYVDSNLIVSYSGNFEYNQRNGFGKYIDQISGIEYSGEWKEGLYNGYGIYQWYDNDISTENPEGRRHVYRGNFRAGKPDGQGVEVYPNGSVRHDGLWENGEPVLSADQVSEAKEQKQKKNAAVVSNTTSFLNLLPKSSSAIVFPPKSTIQNEKHALPPLSPSAPSSRKQIQQKNKQRSVIVVQNQSWKDLTTSCVCVYRGLWDPIQLCPDGNGTAVYHSGAVQTYEGCFKAGLYHGQGRLWYRNGDMYEGSFIAGQRHSDRDLVTGKQSVAIYRWKDGRQYTGQFHANVRQGHGTLVYSNQDLYEGDFVAGQREGHGRFVFATDGSCYTGEWQAGQYHGHGVLVLGHGDIYTGKFQYGLEHGEGELVDSAGNTIYSGEWVQGKRKDEVDAAIKLLQQDAERKKAALQDALKELDMIDSADNGYLGGNDAVPTIQAAMLRGWVDVDTTANTTKSVRSSAEIDNRSCEAVVNEPVTDLLGCPGHYTGIIDSVTRLPHGVGRLVYADGKRIHEGFWKEGSKEGHGRCLFFPQGDFHEGEYKNNLRDGPGLYQWKDGRSFNGSYKDDLRHGHGVFEYPGGEKYDGNFENGIRAGFGRYEFIDHDSDGQKGFYEGLWKDGNYHGTGHIVWGDGVSYTGDFARGTLHGKGVKKDPEGLIVRDGYWEYGVETEMVVSVREDGSELSTEEEGLNKSIDSLETSDASDGVNDNEEKKDDCDLATENPPVDESPSDSNTINPQACILDNSSMIVVTELPLETHLSSASSSPQSAQENATGDKLVLQSEEPDMKRINETVIEVD